jgi:hypothetical protein
MSTAASWHELPARRTADIGAIGRHMARQRSAARPAALHPLHRLHPRPSATGWTMPSIPARPLRLRAARRALRARWSDRHAARLHRARRLRRVAGQRRARCCARPSCPTRSAAAGLARAGHGRWCTRSESHAPGPARTARRPSAGAEALSLRIGDPGPMGRLLGAAASRAADFVPELAPLNPATAR